MNYKFDWKEYAKIAREVAAESCVLLKNDNNILPLVSKEKISIFGRIQFDYIKSGTGSGGMVSTPYVINILDGLKAKDNITINEDLENRYRKWLLENPFDVGKGWAQEPWCQKEMPLSKELIKQASDNSDAAIVIIGRLAGEDKDNSDTEGSYLLTQEEHNMLGSVCEHFDRVIVVLNVGNIIDMNWVSLYKPQAVLYAWQCGCEGGNGVSDVIVGDVNPSGKLPDSIAKSMNDYPSTKNFGDAIKNMYAEDIYVGYRYFETFAKDKVAYPFGYGLSYTQFEILMTYFQRVEDKIDITINIKNIGAVAGKEVVQVYCNPPQGVLGKPIRNLVGFAKTNKILPNESENIKIEISINNSASYDDGGYTGNKSCYVLESGEYKYYIGNDVRSAKKIGSIILDELKVVEHLTQAAAPVQSFNRIKAELENGKFKEVKQSVPLRDDSYIHFSKDSELEIITYTGNKGYKLIDVYNKKIDLNSFIAQLDDEDLICLTRGEGMSSPKVTTGTAGSLGGVTDNLLKFGIPTACCADGPSGIRMDSGDMAFSIPNGTALASTFNVILCEKLFEYFGMELAKNKIETVLGPGMNIHRSPLNGRNFEYFSEDPLLTGKMAVSQMNGLHKYNITGTMKHFACNNQEFKRTEIDSIVSERALREIYLKGFEIAVKEAGAYSIMTTYGMLNGIYTASNYDLVTTILRDEWHFDGIVMTDWWAKLNDEGEVGILQNTSAMIKAQNDIYMVVSDAKSNSHKDNTKEGLDSGKITYAHLTRIAKNICSFILRSPAILRLEGIYNIKFDEINKIKEVDINSVMLKDVVPTKEGAMVDIVGLNTSKGSSAKFNMFTPEKGKYSLSFELSADIVGVAQVPMTIYKNNQVIKTLVINSNNCKNYKEEVEFDVFTSINSFIKLMFSGSGIKIDKIIAYKK